MNMRLPRYLVDSDPLLTNVTQLEGEMVEVTDTEWTPEELENAERQVEQVLLEEEFIAACFEEMLQEEEDQWFHNNVVSTHMSVLYTVSTQGIEQKYSLVSKLNPEAPEFIPRGLAS